MSHGGRDEPMDEIAVGHEETVLWHSNRWPYISFLSDDINYCSCLQVITTRLSLTTFLHSTFLAN
jgi:hypothetical protein